jgi:hypothetical protein
LADDVISKNIQISSDFRVLVVGLRRARVGFRLAKIAAGLFGFELDAALDAALELELELELEAALEPALAALICGTGGDKSHC